MQEEPLRTPELVGVTLALDAIAVEVVAALDEAGIARAADLAAAAAQPNTDHRGTRFFATRRQYWWPGTAPSRENANIMRDAEVTEAVTQKNCATTQMKRSASAQF